MRDGHFRYGSFVIDDIADDIRKLISKHRRGISIPWDRSTKDSRMVIDRLKELADTLERASKMVHVADWLMSDSIGCEEFIQRFDEAKETE